MSYRRRSSGGRAGRWATVGFVGGIVAGLVLWGVQVQRSRRDLFARNPIKRLAALGYLGGQPSVDTAHLLEEYCRWEKHPMLRKRASRLLSRMHARLV